MPRNRQDVDREAKVTEIREAALRILREGGPAALSHSAVAKDLGLARTAIYWYFPTKDDLFVAALTDAYAEDLGDPPETDDIMPRLAWALERLTALQPLTHALHERARHSPAAAELETALLQGLTTRLHALLASKVPPEKLAPITTTIVVFFEGLLVQPRPPEERLRLLEFLISELT
ncbi:TetR/AcrR family transcriptional regulator [Actinomadura barringtoniae]|uniref:TetR/AcrR family transcriptional regulator n=1 Tax=Actinomadura barringtoniae TaxID=1427535 RepID=A0A939PH44_9ACTN|nr:TetR/AcrR family transcriptional regulator [Actinomadura barringtoniae]MBO2452162.1 TetR/AcrR family transcriptional regulator [Actinomadura barringtoniae]